MKMDIARHMAKCLTCQQVKVEHCNPAGLLKSLKIPEWKWEHITMDFVQGLLRTSSDHNAIWVIVDRLTKFAHFLAVRVDYTLEKYADLYVKQRVSKKYHVVGRCASMESEISKRESNVLGDISHSHKI